eukprot:1158748-Pelagomonas_calceolata.AAC.9
MGASLRENESEPVTDEHLLLEDGVWVGSVRKRGGGTCKERARRLHMCRCGLEELRLLCGPRCTSFARINVGSCFGQA